MMKISEKPRAMAVIELLPGDMALEISRIASCRQDGLFGIREISLRRSGLCEVNISGERISLRSRIDAECMERILQSLVGGALYAHRENIASGYISMHGGIRVGVCGSAGYDKGRIVGISSVSSLNFRIPTNQCQFEQELIDIFDGGIGCGMLIYSSPGVGKTSALRSLAKMLGGRKNPLRIAVIDERGEFFEEDFQGLRVDIMRGYKRREGIEIATRTMSSELIIIDEIGADDATAIIDVVRCGVPIIATAHACSFDEIKRKRSLTDLLDCRAFETFVGIFRENRNYRLTVDKL